MDERETETDRERDTERERGRQAGRQKQTGRQADRHTERGGGGGVNYRFPVLWQPSMNLTHLPHCARARNEIFHLHQLREYIPC